LPRARSASGTANLAPFPAVAHRHLPRCE
jgi:hypothetical protein